VLIGLLALSAASASADASPTPAPHPHHSTPQEMLRQPIMPGKPRNCADVHPDPNASGTIICAISPDELPADARAKAKARLKEIESTYRQYPPVPMSSAPTAPRPAR
jgi:hypothetical protein